MRENEREDLGLVHRGNADVSEFVSNMGKVDGLLLMESAEFGTLLPEVALETTEVAAEFGFVARQGDLQLAKMSAGFGDGAAFFRDGFLNALDEIRGGFPGAFLIEHFFQTVELNPALFHAGLHLVDLILQRGQMLTGALFQLGDGFFLLGDFENEARLFLLFGLEFEDVGFLGVEVGLLPAEFPELVHGHGQPALEKPALEAPIGAGSEAEGFLPAFKPGVVHRSGGR
jgi:hypothetical protein